MIAQDMAVASARRRAELVNGLHPAVRAVVEAHDRVWRALATRVGADVAAAIRAEHEALEAWLEGLD